MIRVNGKIFAYNLPGLVKRTAKVDSLFVSILILNTIFI